MIRILLALIALTLVSPGVKAEIYKCTAEDGTVTFSDEPCDTKAEVAFETPNRNFDEVIGNASPYPEQPIAAAKVYGDDFAPHAKKIGECILPGEYNNSFENQSSPMLPGWRIVLFYGPEDNRKEYEITMQYGRNPRSDGTLYVWLDTITIRKDGKPFDPPAMAAVQRFRKIGSGKWKIRLE